MPIQWNDNPAVLAKRKSRMWGLPIPFWETVFRWSTIAAFVMGGLGATCAFISAWVGYELSDISQQEANKQILESQTRIEEARANAAAAGESAAAAKERTAQVELALEKEHVERLRLEAAVSPRRFTADNAKVLQSELAGKIAPICLVSYGGAEPTSYADLIFAALTEVGLIAKAGNTIHRITSDLPNGSRGVSVSLPMLSGTAEDANSDPLVMALRKAGVIVGAISWGDRSHQVLIPASVPIILGADERVLSVGEKPLP
jgi:hypothetical protein